MFKEVFGIDRSKERWNWQFNQHVHGKGWIFVAKSNDIIVGQFALRRNHINFMGSELIAGQSCDTMVNPEFRGRRVFTDLAKKAYEFAQKDGLSIAFSFPNRNSYPGYMRLLKRNRIANLKCYYFRTGIKKYFGKLIDRLFKILLYLVNHCYIVIERKIMPDMCNVKTSSNLADDSKSLLNEHHYYEVLSIWKDFNYMQWRYINHPNFTYSFHTLYVNDRIEGLAVTRNSEDSVAICEFLHRSKHPRQSVYFLRHIVKYYLKSSAQKIEFHGWDNGFFDYVFKACGFRSLPSSFVFTAQAFDDDLTQKLIIPDNWTIVYGDADIV